MRWIVIGIAASVALLLNGCARSDQPQLETPSETIEKAKSATQDGVVQVADLAPDTLVQGLDQSPTGSLVSCRDGKQWAGHATVTLRRSANAAAVIDGIEDSISDTEWIASRDTTGQGKSRLTLRSNSGLSLLIRPDGGASINIASFSDCFALPSDFVPARSY
ncbi:hypothetical protein [Curtobacterium sp. SL109]|uniref:hypothetical protein n=1 Tax=Curtobacterium sp. SL109 TaxID=2994662 RepID=UPI002276D138|nr:hypothetical protein [Curtobacterium sp. SL109]MCY1694849.1 hypothetical protein [Curtobacterium sp. SL109]